MQSWWCLPLQVQCMKQCGVQRLPCQAPPIEAPVPRLLLPPMPYLPVFSTQQPLSPLVLEGVWMGVPSELQLLAAAPTADRHTA